MLPRAYYQHEIVDAAAIPDLLSAAMLYGRGVFTTVAIHDGQAFQWELHWQRLVRDAASIGLSLETYREQQVHDAVVAVSRENALADGRVRISCFDAAAGWVGTGASILGAEMLITAGEFRQLPDRLRVCLSPYRVNSRSPLAGIKSCNYLENLLAFEAARAGGSDEGIRLNDRSHITSACMANIFWLESGRIFTPALSTGCLAGTTRSFVMENFEVTEVEAPPNVLDQASSMFLTSAGIGIAEVGIYEGRELTPAPDEIMRSIKRVGGSVRPRGRIQDKR